MADTYLLIDSSDLAVNLIQWDGTEWHEQNNPEGYQIPGGLRAVKYAGPWGEGWKWDGKQCVDPNPPPPEPPPPQPAPPAPTPSPAIRTI